MLIETTTARPSTPRPSSPPVRKPQTVFVDSFSKEVFDQTYRFATESDINERHFKVALDIASVERPEIQNFWANKFVDLLEDFKFVPGGRITSNAGTGLKGTTYINCFVSGFRGEDQDSMTSIMDELRRQAFILKSEGGYGFCADVLRPRGTFVNGIGGDSPGAVKLLEMWDTQSGVITAGSGLERKEKKGKNKIRKGAQMVTLSIWHPDIVEFIGAKQTAGRLTKFNMSVLVSDRFMKAVENQLPWTLEFPDIDGAREEYRKHWDGNLDSWKAKGYPVVAYKTYEKASELWDLLMKSTYNRNEPGVLFIDTINKLNNLYYAEHINATNPCGEQVLPVGGSCLLGSINLTKFVNSKAADWDYEKLRTYIPIAVRFMDNVNDRSQAPLPEQLENMQQKRRIGLGILGYGSALMMLKVRYGSDKALKLTEELGSFIMNEAYRASADLAREKGAFPLYDADKYLAGQFVRRLQPETRAHIKKHGIRNSHLLSIQPTGNSSVLANNVSGGLEPIFMAEYTRTVIQPFAPSGLAVPTNVNWSAKTFTTTGGTSKWEWIKEGDENLLRTRFDDAVWKFDQSRGLLKETPIKDFAVRYHESLGTWDSRADWASTAYNLKIEDHVRTMEVLSRFVDAAMSKTVNVPADYPYEEFKRLYMDVFKTGTIKGCTSYREGTMTAVLAATSSSSTGEELSGIPRTKAVSRPKSLHCEIHTLTSDGHKWVVLVGLLDGDPYEVFAMKQNRLHLPSTVKKGQLLKEKPGRYNLLTDDGWALGDIRTFFESDEQEALTRMISTALRHGADIEFIVSQLLKSEGTINSFAKAIARTLKGYIKEFKTIRCSECNSKNIKLQEGCFTCLDCGSSKCE